MASKLAVNASICTDETSFDTVRRALIPLSYPHIGQDSRKCSESDQALA